MASVSYGINRGSQSVLTPDSITVGSVAASGNDIVLSIDKTKGLTSQEVIEACRLFIRRLEDDRLASADILNI